MSQEALDLLASIDRSLKALVAIAQARSQRSGAAGATTKAVASDRELDGKFGDPELKFMPRDWTGASFKGSHFSECPPELLDMAAETFEYFARQADEKNERTDKGKPVSDYKRLDAARARGWAARMRSGVHPRPQTTEAAGDEWASGNDQEGFGGF